MPRKKTDPLDVPPPTRTRSTRTKAVTAPNGSTRATAARVPTFGEIAEAAYLRYINRGGGDGADFDDWLAAERELRSGS